ncbi:MAG: transposase [Leptolyngbya sp. Prado105]|jgi:putative transposase|nr:transposase [Leptolyngbya sp. Prado105]
MLVLEYKLKGKTEQFERIDDAIRTGLFVRNSCIRYWMDTQGVGKYELSAYCKVLAKDFEWANKLNSMARQASADRAWAAISQFYANCKKQVPGKKGYPKFKRRVHSVEYKTSGWKLSEDRKYLTLTDGFEIGRLKLIGTYDLHFYQPNQIKRLRLVRRADGYYAQVIIDVERRIELEPSKRTLGLDVGLTHFYTDSNGDKVENPRFLRKAEKSIKRLQRRVSRKFKKGQKQSNNYKKARQKLARKHLKVSRQRKDHAVKLARCVIQSSDLIVYEDLQVRNLVKNHKLAKSINDASWYQFREWLAYFGKIFGRATVAVAPHYTSQQCSECGRIVKKTLSTRTHQCICGVELCRDHNAALNILRKGLNTVGHTGINAWGETDRYLAEETTLDKSIR